MRCHRGSNAAPLVTSGSRRWAILAAMLLGTVLAVLDSSILNVSVMPIFEEFQADLRTIEWVLTSYNLAFATFMIGLGSLGDAAGRRRLYVLGEVVFLVGSGLAAVATGPWQLITFRAVQGLGAAALAPNALALILDHFPEGERGAALGIWGATAALAGALGPTVGGLVAQGLGWRWLFLMNLPLGVLVTITAYCLLTPDPPWGRRFDTKGFFAVSGSLLALSVALVGTPGLSGGWARVGFAALALVLGAWFVRAERRVPMPLVDVKAVLHPNVLVANLAVFFALLIMAGGMFLSVVYAQLLTDATPATIGVLLAPCAAATFLLAPLGGWLADKAGPRLLAVAGLLALAASVAIAAQWSPASVASLVLWSNLIAGAGLGLAMPALIRVSTESVAQQRAGLGAGLYKTANELGGAVGVVLLGTLLQIRIVANALRQIPGHFLPQDLSIKTITSLKVLEAHALQKGLAPQDLDGFHRALTDSVQQGFRQVFGLAAVVAGIGVVVGLLLPPRLATTGVTREADERA